MRSFRTAAALVGLHLAVGLGTLGCSEEPAPAPAPTRPPPGGPKFALAQEASSTENEVEYRYDPTDKRDPFKSFIQGPEIEGAEDPLGRFDLTQLSVTGIIWGTDGPRALIRDPAGKGHIVLIGSIIGKNKGRIVSIDDNVVQVKETYVDALNRATTKNVEMRLREAQGG